MEKPALLPVSTLTRAGHPPAIFMTSTHWHKNAKSGYFVN
jgi:hypothetical protein